MSIYVEIFVRAPMDDLWDATQTPEKHALWDLRFTSIEYLPRPDARKPQQFLYETRIGFGLAIRGKGETVGSREGADGVRTSSLKFWSDSPLSLIREGSGYWQYAPTPDGIRFLTDYRYETRFGGLGRIFDRLVFEPLMGWATAWSFDCLRLWLEQGIAPAVARERSIVYAVARLTLAAIWVYQGVVPKLLFRDSGELDILRHSHLFAGHEGGVLSLIGVGEVVFGCLLIVCWRSLRLLRLNNWLMFALEIGALASQPRIFVAPFNPLTLNWAMIALGLIGLTVAKQLPRARHCRRARPPKP